MQFLPWFIAVVISTMVAAEITATIYAAVGNPLAGEKEPQSNKRRYSVLRAEQCQIRKVRHVVDELTKPGHGNGGSDDGAPV